MNDAKTINCKFAVLGLLSLSVVKNNNITEQKTFYSVN